MGDREEAPERNSPPEIEVNDVDFADEYELGFLLEQDDFVADESDDDSIADMADVLGYRIILSSDIHPPLGQNPVHEAQIEHVDYDIDLPLQHSYLGQLNHLHPGRVIFPEQSEVSLPLFYLNGIILVPGQELPLTFRSAGLMQFFTNLAEGDTRTFGIGYAENHGTTAEIRSFSRKTNHITLKAEGRQRFEVINSVRQEFGIYQARVKILPEVVLKDFVPVQSYGATRCNIPPKQRLSITPVPWALVRQSDNHTLMRALREILQTIIEPKVKNENFQYPEDPTAFSYFVLTSIPLSDEFKSIFLQINCTNMRLRVEHSLLKMNFSFACSNCHAHLCTRDSFVVMSKGGTAGTFVNSHGIIHELYTFSKIANINRTSEISYEFTWFPDYGWIIIKCNVCHLHLGWEFRTERDIQPKTFWALTRRAIQIGFGRKENPESFVYRIFPGLTRRSNLIGV